MLALDKREVDFYNQEHARLASAFAAQAAVAIENARLYEETRQHAFELETLAEISASLRTAKTVPEMLPILLEKTVKAIGASYSVLFLVDPETKDLVSRYSAPVDSYQPGFRQKLGKGITGHVAATGEFYISTDVANDPLLSLACGEADSFTGTVSAISLPLQTQDDLLGVMHIGSDKKRKFTEADVSLLTAVSDIAANALKRASITDTLEERVMSVPRNWPRPMPVYKNLINSKPNSSPTFPTNCAPRWPHSTSTWTCWIAAKRKTKPNI